MPSSPALATDLTDPPRESRRRREPRHRGLAHVPHGLLIDGILYPSYDGEPMSEHQWQADELVDCPPVLREHFRNAPARCGGGGREAYVVANLLLYLEEGNPKNRLAPDVMLAFDVPTHRRSSYLVWLEALVRELKAGRPRN